MRTSLLRDIAMSLNIVHSRFQQAWYQLRQQWQRTTSLWDDPVRWQFEQDFWDGLETRVSATLQAMERLAQVITQARQNVH